MSDNFFLAAAPSPEGPAIAEALGDGYARYTAVLAAAEGFDLDWKHYGAKYGWKLKAHDGIKALFELTVASGSFRVSIAAREGEMAALRADPQTAALLDSEAPAAKSREGWGIRVPVLDQPSCDRAIALIRAVGNIRRGT